jgi:hypothetical protein
MLEETGGLLQLAGVDEFRVSIEQVGDFQGAAAHRILLPLIGSFASDRRASNAIRVIFENCGHHRRYFL